MYNEFMSKYLTLSIHGLVDFVLRMGDIDTRVFNNASMSEGTRIHLRYQKMQSGEYLSEVALEGEIECEDYIVKLMGRADGIILGGKHVIIDEIKSTVAPLDEFFEEQGKWHLGQAICYAYLYAKEHDEEEMEIRLTYISQHDDSKLFKNFTYSYEHLKEKVKEYLSEYLAFYRLIESHKTLRNISAVNLEFPYGEFRLGQRELSKYVYSIAKNGGVFFFEAPTGTGKTISTLYPSVKSFPLNQNEKIFYLSAKNQTKGVALNACKTMIDKGLDIRAILVSSKENMCQCEARMCNPDECIYAKGYYTKLKKALVDLINSHTYFDSEAIIEFAKKRDMCPFELQLDYSLLCDVIICDYNYLFDPLVYLKRYFDEMSTPYFALIDEAHNLAERSLDMYSAELNEDDFLLLQKIFKRNKHLKFKKALKKIIEMFDSYKSDEEYVLFDDSLSLKDSNILENYFKVSQDVLKNYEQYVSEQFITCFRSVNRFLKIHEFYDDSFKIYFENATSTLYLRCLDASKFINKTVKKLRGAVFFSATLTPLPYFIKRLGGSEDDPNMKLPSPFEKNRFLLLVRGDISTKYKNRAFSYRKIASSIEAFIAPKVGNYLVFFPSYQYMNDVLNLMNKDRDDIKILVQTKEMNQSEREIFLNQFQENPSITTLGFAVLGGSFSEGIDLTQDRLIGAVIVGVGLPGVCFERNMIKEYYDAHEENGFDYAYTNPGMNKVMQAAGRVIRTKKDVGAVLLIDERFLSNKYQALFKVEWSHYISVFSDEEIRNYTERFWDRF